MEIDLTMLSEIALGGIAAYVAWLYFNPTDGAYYFNQIDARNKEEFEGYIYGLKKASGNKETFIKNVEEWYKWWITKRPDLLNFLLPLRQWALSRWV